jgi:signal-transduction protein with cAMP-binding, CBS, and nucleotidyltransferase domain
VLLTIHAKLLEQLPFLKDKHPQFLEQILMLMKLEFYAPNEYVVWQNDLSSDMYFVSEGMLEIRMNLVSTTREPSVSGVGIPFCWMSTHVSATSSYIF